MKVIEKIVLVGLRKKRRYLVELNDEKIYLTGKSFSILSMLVLAMKLDGCGWLHASEMDDLNNFPRYSFRLKKELNLNGFESHVIENDCNGNYRINIHYENIDYVGQMMEKFGNAYINDQMQKHNSIIF